jgi:hypothetical protein
MEIPPYLQDYRNELIDLLHKSQASFEKQLSFISAGSLALSIGFIKDLIHDMDTALYKPVLTIGWILMTFTLLINCISHIRAAYLHNLTINDINAGQYNREAVETRYKEITFINWISVTTLILGISAIIFFIAINMYYV